MPTYFPRVLLPNSLLEFYKGWRNNIDKYIEPTRPIEPVKPKEPEVIKHNIPEAIACYFTVGIFIYAFLKSFDFVIIGFFLYILIYTIYYFSSLDQYKSKKKEYEIKCLDYKKSYSNYEALIADYKEKLHFVKQLKNDAAWLERKRLEVNNKLMAVIKKPTIDYISKKGSSEKAFGISLTYYFGRLITTDKTTEIFRYYQDWSTDNEFNKQNNAYVPDFILIHDKSNMIIDIEIDEPYVYSTPIHVDDSVSGKKRDDYFTSNNWFVIRFSERQVLQYPVNCCREIALLIKDYTGDNTFLDIIELREEVPRDKVWDYLTAKNYSLLNVRKNYDKLILKNLSPNSIRGEWINNRKRYLIEANNITELSKFDNKETDKGLYHFERPPCGRLVMSVTWQKSQNKYLLNLSREEDLILTDLYNRKQIIFQRNQEN